jgi:trk system potassium uptake protein
MKIVIGGAGEIGQNLIEALYQNYEITVIEANNVLAEKIEKKYDIQVLKGHIADPDILEKSNLSLDCAFIAVTPDDELNLSACHMAKNVLGAVWTGARLKADAYLSPKWKSLIQKSFDIDLFFSPEQDMVSSVLKSFEVPYAFDLLWMGKKKLGLIGIQVQSHFSFLGQSLEEIMMEFQEEPFQFIQIIRDFKAFFPKPHDRVMMNDAIYFVAPSHNIPLLMKRFGYDDSREFNVFVLGSSPLAKGLLMECGRQREMKMTIIDEDESKLMELAPVYPEALLMLGHPLNPDVLLEAGIAQATHTIAATKDDTLNILASLMAVNYGVSHPIALVQKTKTMDALFSMRVEKMVHPSQVIVAKVLEKLTQDSVVHFYPLEGENSVVVIEVVVSKGVRAIQESFQALRDHNLHMIAGIRQKEVFWDLDAIEENDHLILAIDLKDYRRFQKWFFLAQG